MTSKLVAAVAAATLFFSFAASAEAAWCVWPEHPYQAPHPCRFGGVPVAPSVGYWWGNAWVWGPWHRWGVGPSYRVVPHWRDHDWDHDRGWHR